MKNEVTVLRAEQITTPVCTESALPAKNDFQELLQRSLGCYCVCEFHPANGQYRTQEGILREIGQNYFLLYREDTDTETACLLSSLCFLTCYRQGRRPTRSHAKQPNFRS